MIIIGAGLAGLAITSTVVRPMSSPDGDQYDGDFDTQFSLPGVDDPPSTEIGVILIGLDTERLLAGLGVAATTADEADDDPTLVLLLIDQIRHGVRADHDLADVIAEGARQWQRVRPALAAADPAGAPQSMALRPLWKHAEQVVDTMHGTLGAAACAYLAACWLRRAVVDRYVEDLHGVPALDP